MESTKGKMFVQVEQTLNYKYVKVDNSNKTIQISKKNNLSNKSKNKFSNIDPKVLLEAENKVKMLQSFIRGALARERFAKMKFDSGLLSNAEFKNLSEEKSEEYKGILEKQKQKNVNEKDS